MKHFIKLSLQWRITLLTVLVLTICCVFLTIFSIQSAEKTLISAFGDSLEIIALDNGVAIKKKDDVLPEEEIDENLVTGKAALQNISQAKQTFDINSIIFCLILTVFGTGLVYFVSGKALKPVRILKDRVSKIDEQFVTTTTRKRIKR